MLGPSEEYDLCCNNTLTKFEVWVVMGSWDGPFFTMRTWVQRGTQDVITSCPHSHMYHLLLPNCISCLLSVLAAPNTSLPIAVASSVSLHFLLQKVILNTWIKARVHVYKSFISTKKKKATVFCLFEWKLDDELVISFLNLALLMPKLKDVVRGKKWK